VGFGVAHMTRVPRNLSMLCCAHAGKARLQVCKKAASWGRRKDSRSATRSASTKVLGRLLRIAKVYIAAPDTGHGWTGHAPVPFQTHGPRSHSLHAKRRMNMTSESPNAGCVEGWRQQRQRDPQTFPARVEAAVSTLEQLLARMPLDNPKVGLPAPYKVLLHAAAFAVAFFGVTEHPF